MHWVGVIIIGFLIGLIAKLLMPGRDPGGFFITVILGILGSVVAKYIGLALGLYREGQPAGFIASVIGAILLLILYRTVRGPRASRW